MTIPAQATSGDSGQHSDSPTGTQPPQDACDSGKKTQRQERWVAGILVSCILIVGFWEVMAHRSDRPFDHFELTVEDMQTFSPMPREWYIEALPISPDPVEPNVLLYHLRPQMPDMDAATRPLLVRLVHGFNLVDCMREKGHSVELLASTRTGISKEDQIKIPEPVIRAGHRVQVWRITSPTGDVALWVSSMLRAGDFMQTDVDTRDMPFPRVPFPERASWTPRGITWSSLKHPVQGLRRFLEYKWNSARGDALTFLELRREAWASADELTLATLTRGSGLDRENEQVALNRMLSVHVTMYAQLRAWREKNQNIATGRPH